MDSAKAEKEQQKVTEQKEHKKPLKQSLWEFYEKRYKLLLIIPILMLLFSLGVIIFYATTTGGIIPRDASLKGGITLTVNTDKEINIAELKNAIHSAFPKSDVQARIIRNVGRQSGIIIEGDMPTEQESADLLLKTVQQHIGNELKEEDYTIEIIGASLGESFFRETFTALIVAFIFMGVVILIYFRTFVPSIAIILAAFSDMAFALAVVHLIGMKIGTAGIAAFLMLIGYSVDTDVLLTVRVLKRKEGSINDRIASSIKTGMTMTATAIIALTVALIVTQSEVIRQMIIIMILGLAADIPNTWIQNVGLLRLYIENKQKKGKPI